MSGASDSNPYLPPQALAPTSLLANLGASRVHFSGEITAHDLRLGIPWIHLGEALGYAVGGAATAALVAGDFPARFWDIAARFAIFISAGILIVSPFYYLRRRRILAAWRANYAPVPLTGSVGENDIELRWGQASENLTWSAFVHHEARNGGEPLIWLRRTDSNAPLPLARRFFASDGDWDAMVALVTHNTPRRGLFSAAPPARGLLPADTSGVRFAGHLNREQLTRSRDLRSPPEPEPELGLADWAWMVGGLLMAPVIVGGGLYLAISGPNYPLLAIMVLSPLTLAWQIWKWKSYRVAMCGAAEEVGIRITKGAIEARYAWPTYEGYRLEERPSPLLVLFLPDNAWQGFPRELFASDADWRRFVELVKRKTPEARSRGLNVSG